MLSQISRASLQVLEESQKTAIKFEGQSEAQLACFGLKIYLDAA